MRPSNERRLGLHLLLGLHHHRHVHRKLLLLEQVHTLVVQLIERHDIFCDLLGLLADLLIRSGGHPHDPVLHLPQLLARAASP